LGLGNHRHGLEGECIEGLAGQKAGFGKMSLDAAAVALGQAMKFSLDALGWMASSNLVGCSTGKSAGLMRS